MLVAAVLFDELANGQTAKDHGPIAAPSGLRFKTHGLRTTRRSVELVHQGADAWAPRMSYDVIRTVNGVLAQSTRGRKLAWIQKAMLWDLCSGGASFVLACLHRPRLPTNECV